MTEALMLAFNKKIATEFETKLKAGYRIDQPLTPQQDNFVEEFIDSEENIFGDAKAGTGKTSISLHSATLSNRNWQCKTTHGLCYRALADKIGKRLIVKDSKMFTLLKDFKVEKEDFGPILALARLAKTFGIIPAQLSSGTSLLPDNEETWDDLAFQYDIDYHSEQLRIVRKLLERSIVEAQGGKIDFDDMLYMAVCFNGVFHKYPLVVGDEVQDYNALQHEVTRKSLAPGGRFIGVGDPNQSIYGFRGALADSVPRLIETFNMKVLPLTYSFRCPKAVVREAQKDVPEIESAPNALEGSVTHHSEMTLEDFPAVGLCRNTAPLISLGLKLIAHGRGATIAGREIGKGLVRLVKKTAPRDMAITDFLRKFDAYIEMEIGRKPAREGAFRDKASAIHAVTSMNGAQTSGDICSTLETLYRKGAPGAVHLSTIHRAKGLEWPSVAIIDPFLMPSKYASQDWQLQQERNVRYVAVTRAQRDLHFINSEAIY